MRKIWLGCSSSRFLTPALAGLQAILILFTSLELGLAGPGKKGVGTGRSSKAGRALSSSDVIYETNYRSNTVEAFTLSGNALGVFGTVTFPTGLVFDQAGNLYVSSDDPAAYSIKKFAPDGTVSTFATTGLNGPHALAFDNAGNLYVANFRGSTIEKFTPDGVGSEFANAGSGLKNPVDLAFDAAGNLFVSNGFGGPSRTGSVLKFAPDGTVSVVADSGFQTAFGLAFDQVGNLYVSNFRGSTIEKFSPTGVDLGVFASAGLKSPRGMIFDSDGNLYVANGSSAIKKFSSTGTYLGVFAHTGLGPHFLALGGLPESSPIETQMLPANTLGWPLTPDLQARQRP